MALPDRKSPLLLIDFSRDPDYNIEMSDASMANALGGPDAGWSAEKVRQVSSQHGITNDIPVRCLGSDACPYKETCPIDKALVDNSYKGKNCPIEVVEAFKIFAGFVLDLEIKPEDFSDLKLVIDLVRLNILMRRCDLYMKDKPVWEQKVGGVNQKAGTVYYDKVPVLTFSMQQQVRKDIKEIYDQLIASRSSKVKRDAAMKDVKGATDLFTTLKKAAAAAQELQNPTAKKVKIKMEPQAAIAPAVVDAEFTEIPADDPFKYQPEVTDGLQE